MAGGRGADLGDLTCDIARGALRSDGDCAKFHRETMAKRAPALHCDSAAHMRTEPVHHGRLTVIQSWVAGIEWSLSLRLFSQLRNVQPRAEPDILRGRTDHKTKDSGLYYKALNADIVERQL